MKQMTVLNTRPREQASELSRLLREAGYTPVEAAAIAIVPAWDAAELDSVRQQLAAGAFMWVVLPSQNAGLELAADLRQTHIVCGTATARALELDATVALERFSAAAALDALRSRVQPGQRVLVPRAREGRDELIDGLSNLGVRVIAPVAYQTLSVDYAKLRLQAGGIDVVSLCSPSAVRAVASAVRDELVVCLGATTAQAASAAGLRVDGVAEHTSMAALVESIENLAGARA
jgi:uroporphyrinogen-III synthase